MIVEAFLRNTGCLHQDENETYWRQDRILDFARHHLLGHPNIGEVIDKIMGLELTSEQLVKMFQESIRTSPF